MKYTVVLIIASLILPTSQHGTLTNIPHSIYGCYHGHEGTFFWTLKGRTLLLNMTSHATEDDWFALGFSRDSTMGDDDVVAVYFSNETGRFIVKSLYNPGGHSTTLLRGNSTSITGSTVTYVDGEVTANITKSLELSYPISDLDKIPVYLFFAKGRRNTDNASTPLHKHYDEPTISRSLIALDVKMVGGCITTKTNSLLKLHGFMMVVVWLNMTPLSMFIARYAKFYFKRQALWYTIHRYTGMLSGLLVVSAVCCAYMGTGMELEFERHQLVGIAVVVLLISHVLVALCKPAKDTKHRRLWECVHKVSAALMQCLSVANIVNGLYMLKVHEICYWLVTAQILYCCLLFIVMENPMQLRSCLGSVYRCTGVRGTYFSLNASYTNSRILEEVGEDEDSDFDDITMVQMNLDQPTTRVDFTKYGMNGLVVLNGVATLVITGSLAMT